jgi:transposase-like protein
MARKTSRKRIPRAERTKILAQAKANGWTAQQVAKKYGISAWTYYGWRKRSSGTTKTARWTGRTAAASSIKSGATTAALKSEIRAVLPEILRDEIARTLMTVIGRGTTTRRRRGKK